jgi:hypothetical protein
MKQLTLGIIGDAIWWVIEPYCIECSRSFTLDQHHLKAKGRLFYIMLLRNETTYTWDDR